MVFIISLCTPIDTSFRPAYIPTCATGCNYCGGALPLYANFSAEYHRGVWRIKEGSGIDSRCSNGESGSFAVKIGIYKKIFLSPGDTLHFDIKFRSHSLMEEYMAMLNILILDPKVLNQDTLLLSNVNRISVDVGYGGSGWKTNTSHHLVGWVSPSDSSYSFNLPVSVSFNGGSSLVGDTVAIFIGVSDGWFENWQQTLEIKGCYEIR